MVLGNGELDRATTDSLNQIVDRLAPDLVRENVMFAEIVERIIFSEPFVKVCVERASVGAIARRGLDGRVSEVISTVNLLEFVQNRVRNHFRRRR
jgi:hypothetical protein